MDILTQDQLLLNARRKFDEIIRAVVNHSSQRSRIDQVERSVFALLLELGLLLLRAFAAGAGQGDEGETVVRGQRTLRRSDEPEKRIYRSVFGVMPVFRYVYSPGANKKIEYVPVDALLGMPQGECSYVLDDWSQQRVVQEALAKGLDGLGAILGVQPSVQTAEETNRRMAEHAEPFRLQQPAPPPAGTETILVATADGTSVPMCRADRTGSPHPEAGRRQGSTRRAYVGAVYAVEPFIRNAEDVLDELFREQAAARRPRPQDKRLWAEMAARIESDLASGSERVFVELAIDVHSRDQDHHQPLVCLMDGEVKLWDLQEEWLGRGVQILDFFHVLKRVREVAKVVHPEDQARRSAWVKDQARDLLTGQVETVIRRWSRLLRENSRSKASQPETSQPEAWPQASQDTVSSAIGYFRNNRHRMQYDEYLANGYPIGSGAAEGACRNLVKDRLDGTGMHWRLPGARAMLKTRAIYLSGEWNEFVEFRIQREQQELYHTAA